MGEKPIPVNQPAHIAEDSTLRQHTHHLQSGYYFTLLYNNAQAGSSGQPRWTKVFLALPAVAGAALDDQQLPLSVTITTASTGTAALLLNKSNQIKSNQIKAEP